LARLSSQLSGTVIDRVMPFVEAVTHHRGALEPAWAAGARVREVSSGGTCRGSRIHVGDLIVAVNGTELKDESRRAR